MKAVIEEGRALGGAWEERRLTAHASLGRRDMRHVLATQTD